MSDSAILEAKPERERPGILVAVNPAGDPSAWQDRVPGGTTVRAVQSNASEAAFREVLDSAQGAIIEGSEAPLSLTRRVHRFAPSVQVAILTESPEGAANLRRSMLFAPNLGEVWIVDRAGLDTDFLQRMLDVGRQRGRRIGGAERISGKVEALTSRAPRRRFLPDRYLAGLLELLPEPVMALDEEGSVLFANPAASRILGTEPGSSLSAEELSERLDPADPGRFFNALAMASAKPATIQMEAFPKGQRHHFEMEVAPIPGERPVLALVLHDVTERVRDLERLQYQADRLEEQAEELDLQKEELAAQNEELQSQAREVRQLMEDRSRFYANMSHELRTPINAVLGYSELLQDEIYGPLEEAQRNAISRVQIASRHLLELINDILDLSKIEAGKTDIQIQPIEIPEFLNDLETTLKPLADSQGAELRLSHTCDDIPEFQSDPRRLRQIVLNLVSNAIRYGAPEPVEIRCESDAAALTLHVTDHGPGISPGDLDRIFEEFVQLGDREGGTGLGLPIARTLARLLGGNLTVESEEGTGSTFTLRIPNEAASST